MIEPIFEINFNDPKIQKNALSSNIQCGFEAETIWTQLEKGSSVTDMSWNDIEDLISWRDQREIDQAYSEWLTENHVQDYLDDVTNDWINDNRHYYILDFVDDQNGYDDFRAEHEDDEDYSNLSTKGWAAKFIEEEDLEGEFDDWLRDQALDGSEVWDIAYDKASRDYSIEDFADSEYGGASQMVVELGIEVEGTSSADISEAADVLSRWITRNSIRTEVRSGSYHAAGVDTAQDYWRVEEDSSIDETEGLGAEIISPVYDTPELMISEIKSLFVFLTDNDVITDNSTGMHVTMSWTGEQVEANKVKMAVLLGDKYLLKIFDRSSNYYARSQFEKIEQFVEKLSYNITDESSLAKVEQLLADEISYDKFTAINFKRIENEQGNRLIEFRIAGNVDYLNDPRKIEKTVARYAIAMQAGHDPAAYKEDYVKALIRLFRKPIKNIANKETTAPLLNKPIMPILQQLASRSSYDSIMTLLNSAYQSLEKAKSIRSQGDQIEMFEDTDDITWQEEFKKAQNKFIKLLGIISLDIIQNKNMPAIKSNTIITFRQALKDFGLTPSDVWGKIFDTPAYQQFANTSLDTAAYEQRNAFSEVLSLLFKSKVGEIEKSAFIVQYSFDNDRVFVPKLVFDAADESATTNNQITLRPEYFKVVDHEELMQARYAASTVFSALTSIEQRTNQLEYQQEVVDDEDRNPTHIEQLKSWIKAETNAMNDSKKVITAFKNKYGFAPVADKDTPSMLSYHPEQVKLNSHDMRLFSDLFKISFRRI
jgi:hypothetical protein